ncbi:MAG: hypothetical protein EXR75_00250 [Myxococcales bacterium]|nr:hypothetical protein [Myxococcales bacterium]
MALRRLQMTPKKQLLAAFVGCFALTGTAHGCYFNHQLIGFDADGDGFDEGADCDDEDARVFPGAGEQCKDGVDNDCDGYLDAEDAECDLSGAGGAGSGGSGSGGSGSDGAGSGGSGSGGSGSGASGAGGAGAGGSGSGGSGSGGSGAAGSGSGGSGSGGSGSGGSGSGGSG